MFNGSSSSFKGRPLTDYVRVRFGVQSGTLEGGFFVYGDEAVEAKKCEKKDFETSEEEEKTLGILTDGFCQADSLNFHIAGQWSSPFFRSPRISIAPCEAVAEDVSECVTDSDLIKEAIFNTDVSFFYK